MIIRKNIFKNFKWLKERDKCFIISADYDGLICASFLVNFLGWELVGYYNMEKIWISEKGINQKKELIWVDLNIVPKAGKAIGGHITMLDNQIPKGFDSSCNLNLIKKLSNNDFDKKYPFSTLIFLMWLFNYQIPKNEMARFLILHSDASWLKYQKYTNNINYWISNLERYNWDFLFNNINSLEFEKKVDQIFYPALIEAGANTGFSKLKSTHLKIQSRESQINPDWDEDIILNLQELFAHYLFWSPIQLPIIDKKINGKKIEISLDKVKKIGLKLFIKKNNIFSYAITGSNRLKYTIFDTIK